MGFFLKVTCTHKLGVAWWLPVSSATFFPFGKKALHFFFICCIALTLGLTPWSEAQAGIHAGVTTPASNPVCTGCHTNVAFGSTTATSSSVTSNNTNTIGYYATRTGATILAYLNTLPTTGTAMGATAATLDSASAYWASFLQPSLAASANSGATYNSGAAFSDTIAGLSGSDFLVNTTAFTAALGTSIAGAYGTLVTTFTATNNVAASGAGAAVSGTLPTVSAPTQYIVRLTAKNAGNSATTTYDYPITINPPVPVISSAATATGNVGTAFSYQITASNTPTSYNATGLPPGLSVNTVTGLISGTPTSLATASPYTVTLSATNVTGTGTKSLTITIAPVITSASTATGSGGSPFSYQITASNLPTSFSATGLPSGLAVNTTTGLISGTPSVNGTFNATISATNAAGTGSQALTITLTVTTPVITSATTASGSGGSAFSYQITASNLPTSFGATGLPAGLTINTSTGAISGTPTVNGSFGVTISATNVAGTGAATLTITLSATLPVITSPTTATGSGGSAFSYQITASNVPTSYNATGLPAGLTVNTTTGLISGTPTVNGTFTVTISAANTSGTGTATLTITLSATMPVITSATAANGSGGSAFSYQITASNVPTSYSATGLPAGLTVNTSTGAISGTPTMNGSFGVTISATNAAGTGSATLTITLTATPPVITSALTANGSGGTAFSYQITASNVPTSYNATGLPAGLTVNTSTGAISGTPTVNGSFGVTISATNAAGTGSATLTITLTATPPVITSATTASVAWGAAISYQITASNVPTSYNAIGLPAGVSVNTGTGVISGTATVSGTFNATISAINAAGTGSQALAITIGTAAPVAGAAAMTVQLNTPTTFDLAPFITGSGISGVNVVIAAQHGTATVSGTKVTYTPVNNYFGTDTFSYAAFGNAGTSPTAAVVTVTVVGRPDPSKDARVMSLIGSQTETAQRFSKAQIYNFQHRLETLHHGAPSRSDAGSPVTANQAPTKKIAGYSNNNDNSSARQDSFQPILLAYKPTYAAYQNDSLSVSDINEGVIGRSQSVLANIIVSALTTASIDVATLSDGAGSGAPGGSGGTEIWGAGNIHFGTRDQVAGDVINFSTDGASLGADRRVSDQLVLGMGLGYARDKSTIGTDGTASSSNGRSLSAYGSYQPTPATFIDALIGYGTLNYNTDRYVSSINDFAHAQRNGNQTFGSLASGYEYREEGLLVSPYGRLDFTVDHLDAVTESGAGTNALNYSRLSSRTSQISVGMRVELSHETRFGQALPHARIEYQRNVEKGGPSSIAYADLFNGPRYSVAATTVNTNSLVLGLGSDFMLRSGLKFGIDYQTLRSVRSADHEKSQAINFRLSQELDGKGTPFFLRSSSPVTTPKGIRVDAGYTFDDNISRTSESADKLHDSAYSLNVNKGMNLPVSDHTRATLNGSIGGEKFHTYTGLGRVYAGAQGEFMYRASGEFGTPIWAVFGRAFADQYESDLRDGARYAAGFSVRKPVTDRISLFGALSRNMRHGNSDVFNTQDNAVRVNLDYAMSANGTLYIGSEYRHGDIVSSGKPSLSAIDIATVFIKDDVFTNPQFYDYRFKGKTVLATLGYNISFGGRDSLDFSWRWAQSTADLKPGYAAGSSPRYGDNQISLVYLMGF
jgi:uncharacterized protein YhjY with autotransporter beta-barrel domain